MGATIPFYSSFTGDRMKKVLGLYKTGIFVLVPIFVLVALLGWLWDAAYAVSFGFYWVALGLLVLGPLLFGWVISQKWMRDILLNLFSQIPLVSTVSNVLLNHDFVERLKSGKMPVVLLDSLL